MKQVLAAFYSEPVVALGVVQAAATVLVAEEVVTGWVGILAVAICVPLQRHFVRPQNRRHAKRP